MRGRRDFGPPSARAQAMWTRAKARHVEAAARSLEVGLLDLPCDILLHILRFLHIPDLAALHITSATVATLCVAHAASLKNISYTLHDTWLSYVCTYCTRLVARPRFEGRLRIHHLRRMHERWPSMTVLDWKTSSPRSLSEYMETSDFTAMKSLFVRANYTVFRARLPFEDRKFWNLCLDSLLVDFQGVWALRMLQAMHTVLWKVDEVYWCGERLSMGCVRMLPSGVKRLVMEHTGPVRPGCACTSESFDDAIVYLQTLATAGLDFCELRNMCVPCCDHCSVVDVFRLAFLELSGGRRLTTVWQLTRVSFRMAKAILDVGGRVQAYEAFADGLANLLDAYPDRFCARYAVRSFGQGVRRVPMPAVAVCA